MSTDPTGEHLAEIAHLRALLERSLTHTLYLEAQIERAAPVLAAADAWARVNAGWPFGADSAEKALVTAVEAWKRHGP